MQTATAKRVTLASCNRWYSAPLETNAFCEELQMALCLRYPPTESDFRSSPMADIIFILVTVLFFIGSWLYVLGLDRL